jgi:hypothetical protein
MPNRQRAIFLREAEQSERAAQHDRELAKEEANQQKRAELIRKAEILEREASNYRRAAEELKDEP